MQRREILKVAACSAGALAANQFAFSAPSEHAIPIIDAHIHLFDPRRPGGVPWPEKDDAAVYKPALPERYAPMSARFGVVGAIAVEASPLPSDNDWLLHIAEKHPLIVGIVGDLIPGSSSYSSELERLHANPLFRGIRYGNIWNRDLAVDMERPGFIDGLKALAQAGLSLDSANPDSRLIHALLIISGKIPGLRIVIDHLPHSPVPEAPGEREEYWACLQRLAQNRNVFVKLSEIPVVENGELEKDPDFYRGSLDTIWNIFGEDHILFGSDWPNSDHVAPFEDTLSIVRSYISRKTPDVQEKYFWKNSIAAYQWHSRRPDQPKI
jgi:L-fuconolactonase